MKIRPSIFWFTAIIAVLVTLLLWHQKKKAIEIFPEASVVTNAAPPATTAPNPIAAIAPVNTNTQAQIPAANAVQPVPQSKWNQMQQILATQNDIPIDFYGKIEDQFGNGVASTIVHFSIGVNNGYESSEKRGQVSTDDNGIFTITGYRGQDLGVMPEKTGYVVATTSTLFKYSHLESHPYMPDKDNPTIIKVWKLQGAENLISFNIKTYVPVDGTAIIFDLQTGQQVQSGGDLAIRITSPVNPNLATGYDWQTAIQMINGGIIQDSSGLGLQKMFQAPDSGYEPESDLSFQKDTQQWKSRFINGFYFRSQNGQIYGKMALSIITDRVKDGAVPIALSGYLNPAGSRNLEIDPAMTTSAHP